jgi:hypothetical protein
MRMFVKCLNCDAWMDRTAKGNYYCIICDGLVSAEMVMKK